MDGPTSNPRINAFLASLHSLETIKERYGTLDCDRCVDFFEFIQKIGTSITARISGSTVSAPR